MKGCFLNLKIALVLLAIAIGRASAEPVVEVLRLPPGKRMIRAELHYVKTTADPKAVLVLCPGCNGSGEGFLRSPEWLEFARAHDLGLVGLSFASPGDALHDGTGYYYASEESGAKLVEGINKIYGKDLPLLLFGFSGGAHFVSRFEEWNSSQVLAWCANSAAWWTAPQKSTSNPPGIVVCGEIDERLGASLIYFKQGRAMGKPWLWVCLPNTGHAGSAQLDAFVRDYFSRVLNNAKQPAIVDIDRKTIVSNEEAKKYPSLTGWLPSNDLFDSWEKLHGP